MSFPVRPLLAVGSLFLALAFAWKLAADASAREAASAASRTGNRAAWAEPPPPRDPRPAASVPERDAAPALASVAFAVTPVPVAALVAPATMTAAMAAAGTSPQAQAMAADSVAGEGAPTTPADSTAADSGAAPKKSLLAGLLPFGQEQEPGRPEVQLTQLTYERDFFYYDGAGRRDPFQPLLDVDLELEGPRFDELILTGIFVGEDGGGMVVVEDADHKGYFLKPGDVVGKATLLGIESDQAVFDVRDFGISRQETLKLQRPEETP